jgi:hypothetical protein
VASSDVQRAADCVVRNERRRAAAATSSGGGDIEAAIVDLMMSRIGFEANARVAQSAADTLNTLLDIKV